MEAKAEEGAEIAEVIDDHANGALMDDRGFGRDDRHTEPDETGHRRARLIEGWRKGVEGPPYKADTLRVLTWDNLGYRLGHLFGKTDGVLVEQMYNWCVQQQPRSRNHDQPSSISPGDPPRRRRFRGAPLA